MTDKEIKNLIDRHEIFVSEEYKSKGIKARFTEFGRMATMTREQFNELVLSWDIKTKRR